MKRLSDFTHHDALKKSREDVLFAIVISAFLIGTVFFGQPRITGMVAMTEYSTIDLNSYYNESRNFTLYLEYNASSIRADAEFIGEGRGRIYADGLLIVDSDSLESGNNLITGMAIDGTLIPNDGPGLNHSPTDLTQEPDAENLTNHTSLHLINTSLNSDNLISGNITVSNPFDETVLENNPLPSQNSSSNQTEAESNPSMPGEEESAPNMPKKKSENYCSDTCNQKFGNRIVITIELEDTALNLSRITYGHSHEEAMMNITEEITSLNISTNTTIWNLTLTANATTNESYLQNLSMNLTLNNSLNITINSSLNSTANMTLNDTIYAENITLVPINETVNLTIYQNSTVNYTIEEIPTALFNLPVLEKEGEEYRIGIDNQNNVLFRLTNESHVEIRPHQDARIRSSYLVSLSGIKSATITLDADFADSVLVCMQFTEDMCKKWKKLEIPIVKTKGAYEFRISDEGIYALADTKKIQKEYISANSLYFNTNCKKCFEYSDCMPENYCVITNKLSQGYDFVAQLDFDIFQIEDIQKAEVCSYVQYNPEYTINYVKYSENSYCSDLNLWNSTSDTVNYRLINQSTGWICIDAKEIIRKAQEGKESNVFLDWIGQDTHGSTQPLTCFSGITGLENCGGYNPSGASDCRPYLKLEYR